MKGGLSDSMKRAAVEWGVGRYLYGMTQIWVKIVQRGKGFFIVDEEQPKLDKAHEDWVRKIQAKQSSQPQGGQGQPPAPGPAQPKQPQQDAAPPQTSQTGPAPAPAPQPQAQKTPGGISGLRDGSRHGVFG